MRDADIERQGLGLTIGGRNITDHRYDNLIIQQVAYEKNNAQC